MKKDSYSYRGWLNSDSLWKRVFGVWGHYALANILLGLVAAVVAMLLAFSGMGMGRWR